MSDTRTTLQARGRVLRPGRNLMVTQAEVFVHQEGGERQCAVLLQTLMCMHGRSDSGERAT